MLILDYLCTILITIISGVCLILVTFLPYALNPYFYPTLLEVLRFTCLPDSHFHIIITSPCRYAPLYPHSRYFLHTFHRLIFTPLYLILTLTTLATTYILPYTTLICAHYYPITPDYSNIQWYDHTIHDRYTSKTYNHIITLYWL